MRTVVELLRKAAFSAAAVALAFGPATVLAGSQDPAGAPTQDASASQPPAQQPQDQASDGSFGPIGDPGLTSDFAKQRYRDAQNRFGFVPPPNWGRLPSKSADEIVFQSDLGDNISVAIDDLKVDRDKLLATLPDTYLNILSEAFEDVRYLGQRTIKLSGADATDFVYTGVYKNIPVSCHQVVLTGNKKVLYITFAGYGAGRQSAEQYFFASLLTFWVSPAFTRPTVTASADPSAPAFTLPIPEEWVEQPQSDPSLHVFRPPGARPTSASITTRILKPAPGDHFVTVDSSFIDTWKERLRASFAEGTFSLSVISPLMLGGEPGVKFDYVVITNEGTRRVYLALAMHKDYVVGIACEAAQQGFPIYEKAFDRTLSEFKFQETPK